MAYVLSTGIHSMHRPHKEHEHISTKSMFWRYACQHVHNVLLPLPPSVHFTKHEQKMGELLPSDSMYCNLVESLNHLSQCTRPDVTYAAMHPFSK